MHRLWLISNTTKRPTTSEFFQLFRTSAKFFQSAFLAILNHALREALHSLCLAVASLIAFRLTLLRNGSVAEDLHGLARPFGIQLLDGPADGESPRKLTIALVPVGDDVALDGFFHRQASLVRLFGLLRNVVKAGTHFRDAFLSHQRAVPRNKKCVLVERCKIRQRGAPP